MNFKIPALIVITIPNSDAPFVVFDRANRETVADGFMTFREALSAMNELNRQFVQDQADSANFGHDGIVKPRRMSGELR